jgi:hypothetical protein
MSFTDSGQHEGVKGAVHGAAFTLFAIIGVYNAIAWRSRRERHLAVNVAVSAVICGWELYQVRGHL